MNFEGDIWISNITLVAGGKTLLEQATLKLVKGRKYGLVGRNGIGKTTLINAISKREFEKFPQNIHVLQVEQEVDGDDVTVMEHVVRCDKERLELYRKQQELINTEAETELEKIEHVQKLQEINGKLNTI